MREDLEKRERIVVKERSEEEKAKARLKVGAGGTVAGYRGRGGWRTRDQVWYAERG
jgi:hypothetical protein